MTTDDFWLHNYCVLTSHWHEFYPTKEMSPTERLNAITRFLIYATAIVAVVKKDVKVLQYAFVGLIVVVISYKAALKSKHSVRHPDGSVMGSVSLGSDSDSSAGCVGPTPENPFMNRLVGQNPSQPSCSHEDEHTKELSEHLWRRGLYQNVDDVYNTQLSSRQFYTNADNQLPNDQKAFAQALYGDKVRGRSGTCKEDTRNCSSQYF